MISIFWAIVSVSFLAVIYQVLRSALASFLSPKYNPSNGGGTQLPQKRKVAIIGGGPSGVSAAKCLMDEGHEVVLFEKSNCVGGNWVYSESEAAHSSIYDTVVVNTSKEHMCFSDYPLPPEMPVFLPHQAVKEYFESYVRHFRIQEHIRFNTKVVWVEPVRQEGGNENRRFPPWQVVSMKVNQEGEEVGEQESEIFDAVVVCNGHHWSPRWPSVKIPGHDDFQGEILHSHSFKSAKRFADKKVVVIGVGGSGCDIATDCSKVSPHVYLSSRTGCFVIPKWYLGKPFDHVATTRFMTMLPLLAKLLFMLAMTYVVKGNSSDYGLRQKFMKKTHPAVNQEILSCIMRKKLQVKPQIKRINKNSVVFTDGSEVEADVIIFATGYHVEFPFMDSKKLIGYAKDSKNDICLYKYVVPLDYDNLYFVGLFQSLGGFFPIAELQSRWVAALLAGRVSLPSRAEMKNDIKKKQEKLAKDWVKESKHMIQVDFVPYCDEMADLIGVKPKLWKHLDILRELLFGVVTPVQYRLDGPGKWAGARQQIKEIYQRSKQFKAEDLNCY